MAKPERSQRLIISPAATRKITGIIPIDKITNDKYDELSPKADEMIDRYSREQTITLEGMYTKFN